MKKIVQASDNWEFQLSLKRRNYLIIATLVWTEIFIYDIQNIRHSISRVNIFTEAEEIRNLTLMSARIADINIMFVVKRLGLQ